MGRLSSTTLRYIFFELLPSFLLGNIVFIFILLMFQALRFTEFYLVHGVPLSTIGEMMGYMAISYLPALFPMSLLFSILLTYGRLSNDSEIVAFKASGLNMGQIAAPAILLGIAAAIISAQVSFQVAPWGNRQFELLISRLSASKASVSIKEGTFSEGFFDLVVYANQVDSNTGELRDVFIYDERQNPPLTIISKTGFVSEKPGLQKSVTLRLRNGDIHRKTNTHTKIHFDTYEVDLSQPLIYETREKSPPSLTLDEIQNIIKDSEKDHSAKLIALSELHKRWGIAAVCLIFSILGVGLGSNANQRKGKGTGMVLSIVIIILYWIAFVSAESIARSGQTPVALAIWTPNIVFLLFGLFTLKKNWN